MVAEYLHYREGTKCEVVQLIAALDLDIEFKFSTHGQITAVIR